MALSFTDFEGIFAGLGVIVILCATLVYLFLPGMRESMLHDTSTNKAILGKSGKKEFPKKKKKVKKKISEKNPDELDDSISECSNTSTVLNALPPSPFLPQPSSSESQSLPVQTKINEPINLESRNLLENRVDDECINKVSLEKSLEVTLPSEDSSIYPTTDNVEMEGGHSTQNSDVLTTEWLTSENEEKSDTPHASAFPVESFRTSNKSMKRTQKKGGDHHFVKGTTNSTGYKINLTNFDTLSKQPPPIDKLLTNLSALTDMQNKVKYLEKLIKQNKSDLEVSRQENSRMKLDNARLKTEKDEAFLNLQNLQANLSDITEQNTVLAGDKHFLETKLKSLDSSYLQLRSQLNATNMEAASQKVMAEKQLQELRQNMANFMTVNRAQASNSKEWMRAQEVMSNENQMLKVRCERNYLELERLRKTSTLQLAELQNVRSSRDVYATNQVMWEEERKETRSNLHKLSLRNSQLEVQLQQFTNEVDLAHKQAQEFASALATLQTETAHRIDQDQLQAKVISSLKYQFEDLNSEKQRLSDAMLAVEASYSRSIGELRARVAGLKCELDEAIANGQSHAERADKLAANVEILLEKQSPTLDEDETIVTSSTMLVSSQNSAKKDVYTDQIASLEAARVRALQEAQDARNQQALMENTLMETESVLARLQRSIEEEETHWRNLLSASELENIHLKNELRRIMRNGGTTFKSNGCATSTALLKSSNISDAPELEGAVEMDAGSVFVVQS